MIVSGNAEEGMLNHKAMVLSLIHISSGGNHYLTGDILDTHHYPHPRMTLLDTNRATVLGEYGGIGLVMNCLLYTSRCV